MNSRRILTAGLVLLAGLAIVAASGARSGRSDQPSISVRPPKISALESPAHLTRRQRRDLVRLRRHLRRTPGRAIAASADPVAAHPVDLPEGLGDAWVTKADDGAVCTFIPDPLGGYASSCATTEDLQHGGAITALGGAGTLDGEAVAVLVVVDGAGTPVITSPDGQQSYAQIDGLGATLLEEESSIEIGNTSMTVPAYDPGG